MEALLAEAFAAFAGIGPVRPADLEKLPAKGLTHRHWRVRGQGMLLRVPVRTLDLGRQAAAFLRAGASGHAPRLHGVIPPGLLPFGALVVEEIAGRLPHLPADLPLLADALAAIHRLDPPATAAPLPDPPDPFGTALAEIVSLRAGPAFVPVPAGTRAQLDAEQDWLHGFARREVPRLAPVRALVLIDAHPGNFLVAGGRAVFLDFERAQYGNPAADAAHASLRPATRWDPDCGAVLARDAITLFLRAWRAALGGPLAAAVIPWLTAWRRLVWLRTAAMFAHRIADPAVLGGLEPRVRAHAGAVIADALDPATIAAVREEWLGPEPLDDR